MIDHERKLIFIHVARTAGTSIESALIGRDWWEVEPLTKHISCRQARKVYGRRVWREYVTFTVVRNPWDRMASMWKTGWWWQPRTRFRGRKPDSFHEFIRKVRPHPHERYKSLRFDRILNLPVDHVLRFENLTADLATMLATEGMAPAELPHVMQTHSTPYQEYYDTESRELVRRRFRRDIEQYGYRFD